MDQLREKLLANLNKIAPPTRNIKPSDTHAIAAAKKTELSKMARALGTRPDYQEGDAFNREKQEEERIRRIAEREEREKIRAENKAKMAEQKAKWEQERKERDRQRQKEEERRREERASNGGGRRDRDMPPPPLTTICALYTGTWLLCVQIGPTLLPPTTGMKVTIDSYRPIAYWAWNLQNAHGNDSANASSADAEDDVCGICRVAFDGCCSECKIPGDDCPLSQCILLTDYNVC